MPTMDDGSEALVAIPGGVRPIGLLGALACIALSSTVMQVDVEGGQLVADGKVGEIPSERLDCQVGVTLADLSEAYTAVVAYYLPATDRVYLRAVDGAVALTSAGAALVTDDEIAEALPEGAKYAICLDVLFARSGSTVTATINRVRRPVGVVAGDSKAVSSPNDSSDDALYRPWGTIPLWAGLATQVTNGDMLTDLPLPPIHGKIRRIYAVTEVAITTAAKTATLNAEIGAVEATGDLVVAGTKAKGVVTGQEISAVNTFVPGDTLSLVASAVTAFTEGELAFYAEIDALVGPGL